LPRGELGEGARGPALALLEAGVGAAAHRVDQVVRDIHALTGARQSVGPQRVALVQLVTGLREIRCAVGVAHERSHVGAACGERLDKTASDEAGRACYQSLHGASTYPALSGINTGVASFRSCGVPPSR
jgi:hypothetical protein